MATHQTKLSFNTDGTEVMRQLLSRIYPDYLFLDEIHGYSVHTEIAAMNAKNKSDNMTIIPMSATLDVERLQEYYKSISRDIPVIRIPGRTFGVDADYDSPHSYIDIVRDAIYEGENILCFAPGKKEIYALIEQFTREFGEAVEIFPLHSEIPRTDQDKLLSKESSKPRIIVSTNVAEESITIPYMGVVLDTATHKVLRYDRYGTARLSIEDTSKANVKQRFGRV
jgi:ATP-dependent helicase HrpA